MQNGKSTVLLDHLTDDLFGYPTITDTPVFRLNVENAAPRSVYESLRDHQLATSGNLRLLHAYLPPINKRFYEGKLPLPALSWDFAHPNNLGWYLEKDGLALSHRINLNRLHAHRPLAEILRTLTHELGHEWQYLSGKPPKKHSSDNYHNKQFQNKMLEIGIPCNKRGISIGMQHPFVSFLQELGVEAEARPFTQEEDEEEQKSTRPGSRLKPWSCGCTRIWASIRVEIDATCAKKGCGNKFQRHLV